jgi:iron uptake system component EfeO
LGCEIHIQTQRNHAGRSCFNAAELQRRRDKELAGQAMSNPSRKGIASAGPPLQRLSDRVARLTRPVMLCVITVMAIWVCDANAGSPSLDGPTEAYRRCLIEDFGRVLAGVRLMRDRMEAHDLDGARQAWVEARIGWERSEVFTSGFVPDLDRQIDAWPNARHGFHGIEAILFGANRPDSQAIDVREEADALIVRLSDLHDQIHHIPLPPQRLLNGIGRLAFEIGGSKADGGESRVSGTSLNDMRSNADGIALAYRIIFSEAVAAAAPRLAQTAQAAIDRLKASVQAPALRNVDIERLRADGEELVAILQRAAPEIGLDKPALEEAAAQ